MNYKRHNWGKTAIWHPRKIFYPSSLEMLQNSISQARQNNEKIRTIGSLHSLNSLCATSEIQIHTDKLNRILEIDKENKTVTVECGIKIDPLLESLAQHGLSLPNQGYIIDQTIAGAIATATHGSGKTGTLSSFIEEINLLDAMGNLHHLSPKTNPHLFSAAVVNLGCLGIIYSLKLRCIPLEKLRLTKIRTNLSDILSKLPSLLQGDYFQFTIDPYSSEIIQWRYEKTHEKIRNRIKYRLHWLLVKILAVATFDIMPTPHWILLYLLKIYLFASPIKACVDYSYKLLSPADEGHYIEEEIAVPLEFFEAALTETRNIIDRFRKQKICLVVVILVRFADPDLYGYLSPAKGRQTAYISLITIAKEGYKELFKAFENALYQFQGHPHWGKWHCLTKERVMQLYGEDYAKFLEAKRELDPEGIFSNEYIHALF